MKKLLILPLFILSLLAKGQYDPSKATVTNKPLGVAQAVPTDARSYYYSPTLFIWRPYQSTAEVLSTLNIAKYRIGHFPIYVSTGALQSNGSFVGGTIKEYWFKDGVADSSLVEKTSAGGETTSGTVAQLRTLSTTTGRSYTSTNFGGGTWTDIGLYDGATPDDGALYLITANNKVLKRETGGVMRPEWFGINGTSDQTAINLALGANPVKVILDPKTVYHTSGPIRMTKGQILQGNKATIISTSTTNIIEGKTELLSNIYQHIGAVISDVTLISATAHEAINLKGFTHSQVINADIQMTNVDTTDVGIHLEHGSLNYQYCYFNEITNPTIYLDGPGTAILISGAEGVSGANVNSVVGGVVSGMDRYAVRLKNNSTGNIISNLDAEHFNPSTGAIAYLVESSGNTFTAPHIENYPTAIKLTELANNNVVNNITAAAYTTLIQDLASDHNMYMGVNSTGAVGMSIGASPEFGNYTKIRVAGTNYPSIRIDSKYSAAESRNWALMAGFSGDDFSFVKSNAKGGDPVAAGTAMWTINPQGHFVLPQQIKMPGISNYTTNTAAAGDGWANGFFYTTPDGIVRSVKSSVGGTHVEVATAADHAIRLQQLTDSLTNRFSSFTNGGQFALSGSDIYNTNTGKIGLGNPTPLEKLDVNTLDDVTSVRVGYSTGSTTGIKVSWNNASARGQISTTGNYPLHFGVANRRQMNINDNGLTIGETATFFNSLPPVNGLLVEGRAQAARATQAADLLRKDQFDSAEVVNRFILRNSLGAGDTIMKIVTPGAHVAMKTILVDGASVTRTVTDTTIHYSIDGIITGLATLNGNASQTVFDIVLATTPTWIGAPSPANAASVGITYTEPITNGMRIHFATAPPSGSGNISFYYSYK